MSGASERSNLVGKGGYEVSSRAGSSSGAKVYRMASDTRLRPLNLLDQRTGLRGDHAPICAGIRHQTAPKPRVTPDSESAVRRRG